jgi:hypothetical protein
MRGKFEILDPSGQEVASGGAESVTAAKWGCATRAATR